MFDNAKLFNGPDSWVTKHEVHMHMHAYVICICMHMCMVARDPYSRRGPTPNPQPHPGIRTLPPDPNLRPHQVGLRSFLEKKMAEACKKMAQASAGGSAGVRGNVATITIDDKMLTPQMRLHLYHNCSALLPRQLRDFRELVRQLCPTAIEDGNQGEVKIDVDLFDFRTFMRVDTWVRLQALQVLTTA